MKPSHVIFIRAALAICGVLVVGAMSLLTRNVRASLHDRELAGAKADLEERTRLALWRMDAAGSAVLLRENQRPAAAWMMPDNTAFPEVKRRFEVRGGTLISPGGDEELRGLRTLLKGDGDISTLLHSAAEASENAWQSVPKDAQALKARAGQTKSADRASQAYQEDSNKIEMAQRAKVLQSQETTVNTFNNGSTLETTAPRSGASDPVAGEIGSMRPVWIGGELFLVRRLALWNARHTATSDAIQGVWLDAQAIRGLLLTEISDLLPGAALSPANGRTGDPLALVSLPFQLHRGPPVVPVKTAWSGALIAAWIAVIAALVMAALLVHGVMRLSERRASFVSAVTHELRTPLTTFRLYSDMLETGAVKPENRGDYLRVLSREADRLSHLVENVLAFSRIERGNARSSVRTIPVGELLELSRERLEDRLATAGLTLKMESSCETAVRVDTAAVEHIFFNLIDNAAKYAAAGDPPEVTMQASHRGGWAEIRVADHGPGIADAERGRIFQAFHKSAREAAESRPGVGLGLALSRRLARGQGGDLFCEPSPCGACFVLRLKAALVESP